VPKHSRSLQAAGFEPQDKGTVKIDLVARNNGAGPMVYRWEGSIQELLCDDRKVAEHLTLVGNGLNKSRERHKY